MRKLGFTIVLTVGLLSIAGCPSPPPNPKDMGQQVLNKSIQLEIISLDPAWQQDPMGTMHNFRVLGSTTITGGEERKEVLDALKQSLEGKGDPGNCFDPRHAIRAAYEGHTVEILVC